MFADVVYNPSCGFHVRVVLLWMLYDMKCILNSTILTDVKFYSKRGNRIRAAIKDIEQVQESLEDVSNNENEYFEADETNIDGKKKHDDDEVGITPEEEYEDLRANDFERDAAPGRRRKNKGDAAFAEVF